MTETVYLEDLHAIRTVAAKNNDDDVVEQIDARLDELSDALYVCTECGCPEHSFVRSTEETEVMRCKECDAEGRLVNGPRGLECFGSVAKVRGARR